MNTRSKSGLFMIELVIVIVIFSILSAECLKVFFHSRQIADQSQNLSRSTLAVQSVADCYKSANGDLKQVTEIMGGVLDGEKLTLYFSPKWEQVGDINDAGFCVTIVETAVREGTVTAEDLNKGSLFSVKVRGGWDFG